MANELLHQILTKLDTLDNKVDIIQKDIFELKTDHPLIQRAVLETNDDVKEIKESDKRLASIQEKQDEIIRLLSIRSIEQEAELKKIK